MIRTFTTHKIRKSAEISSCLWSFRTLDPARHPTECRAHVPSCWETYPDTANYRGRASYVRTVEASGNVRLEFKGVSHTAAVYWDGAEVAHHYNAYTSFDALIPNVKPGVHTLEVIADNSFGEASALHVPNDYQSYGGISRAVVLEQLPDAYIQWVHFTPVSEDKTCRTWNGAAEVCVRNLSGTPFCGTAEAYLDGGLWASVPISLGPGEAKCVSSGELACRGAESWSPEDPRLYEVTAVLKNAEGDAIDDLIDRVGFRSVVISGRDILLNGKRLFIKGLCRHEDHPQFGCALPFAAMQADLMLAKDLGANSIRTSHYPNDELFLDLCDEQGILVWEENHARGLSEEQMRNPNFQRQCLDCIREMITAHYNHPSIYIWGILNECASHTEYGKSCYAAQYALIRELDPYRPRSSASCQFKTDICFGLPEVVSYNIYPKWYHDTPAKAYLEDLYRWVQTDTQGAGKPFLVSEIGAGAIYGYRTPARVKWSEEYQAEALEEQITAVFEQEGCCGIYIWQFCDCRVCGSWFGGRPRTMNNKGVVDEYRRPKLAYDVVKRLFRGKADGLSDRENSLCPRPAE